MMEELCEAWVYVPEANEDRERASAIDRLLLASKTRYRFLFFSHFFLLSLRPLIRVVRACVYERASPYQQQQHIK